MSEAPLLILMAEASAADTLTSTPLFVENAEIIHVTRGNDLPRSCILSTIRPTIHPSDVNCLCGESSSSFHCITESVSMGELLRGPKDVIFSSQG
ncbi:hypothetical protein VNO77_03819 [Canavalia gladiata]|uniref:Uncharacterized protein n=1 Tax=Canavalia gladiata TaxID=3824 RepID=A0AAN9N0I8_CANGL